MISSSPAPPTPPTPPTPPAPLLLLSCPDPSTQHPAAQLPPVADILQEQSGAHMQSDKWHARPPSPHWGPPHASMTDPGVHTADESYNVGPTLQQLC